jgi:hypothetical protein
MSVTRVIRNNSVSPWGYTDFEGMHLAMMITTIWGDKFNATERYILIVLYAARVKGTDLLDHRITYTKLARHCRVSFKTVQRAMGKFIRLGLINLDQEAEGREAQYLSVHFEAMQVLVDRHLGHTPNRGYD